MSRFLPLALAWLFAALLSASATEARPNVLFILVDDLGYGDLGCYGGVGVPTPNIDQLAKEGTRFTQFYSASPICSPSRIGFTTGTFPARWRITSFLHERAGNRADDQVDWLDPQAPSLARLLQGAGYATGHFGKWHMGGGRDVDDAPLPSAYGFDESLINSVPIEGMGPATAMGTPRWKTTSIFIERTLDFIKHQQAAGKPFYINLWFSEMHDAHIPRPEDADPALLAAGTPVDAGKPKYPQNLDAFRRSLQGFDRDLGRLLAGLKELGVDQNTLLLFTGDNGPQPLYEKAGGRARTGGLRGQKWSLYEGGIREPFLVRWPAQVPAGRVDETSLLSAVDFLPTVCSLAGVTPPAQLDGENVRAAWLGQDWKRTRPLLWDYGRTATFKKPPGKSDQSPNLTIRDVNWKFLINADGSTAELYDLAADPQETRNLVTDQPAIAERLQQAVLSWRKSLP